jgi:CubicO group peptidase (beta-lactamase class C family)
MTPAPLPRSTPEAQGIASSAILAFVEALEREVRHVHSVMLLRHGRVVAEGWWSPCAAHEPHELYSLTKSFTAAAMGLAVAEGRLTVDDRLVDLFPKQLPAEVSDNLAAMRVRHLLSMSTGHEQDVSRPTMDAPDGDLARGFLSAPVQRQPGTHFAYNTAASQMLAEILHQKTGQTLLEYLSPRLFEPLGIEPGPWEMARSGTQTGGFGLSLRNEDIARFGQLYVERGMFGERRILPEAWVAQASSMQTDNRDGTESDWRQGYGFQFWMCRHGLYRGDGAFGQFCIIFPQHDAVLAITAGTNDMQSVMTAAWTHLLPAFAPQPLSPNTPAASAMAERLAHLSLPTVQGKSRGEAALCTRGYALSASVAAEGDAPWPSRITAMKLRQEGASCRLNLTDSDGGNHTIEFGHGRWTKGVFGLGFREPMPVAGSYAWTDPRTWTGRLWAYRTPYCRNITCRFDGNKVSMEVEQNVSFGPTNWPAIQGRAIEA